MDSEGILVLNKPENMTSHDAVNIVRKLYNTKQVGHTGTLDPMATGVLVILIGRSVKASQFIMDGNKKYSASLKLGFTSDTEDIWGNVIPTSIAPPNKEEIISIINSFCGEYDQIPPMYSSIKQNGRKLIDLARQGIEVDRPSRRVFINSINVTCVSDNEYKIDVDCSKGTYIRSLCRDIGNKAGCGGIMSSLLRKETTGFNIINSYTIEQLNSLDLQERQQKLLPTETVFNHLPVISLRGFFLHLCRCGCEIYREKAFKDISVKPGDYVRLYDDMGFFALGLIKEYPDGIAVKAIKTFRLENIE